LVFLFTRKYRPLLGLDITTSSVKLIELSLAGGQYRVEAYAAEPMPVNSINEKTIVDAEAVGEAIRRAVKRSGAKSKEVAIAISGDAAITKVIQMPRNLRGGDLEAQVELQADQYIPFPMDEVSYDFEVMGPSEKDNDSLDVLLVATRTENVEQRQAAVAAAGLTAKIVDVEAFALENACKLMTHQMPDGGIDRTIAVVDFGASSTTFSVLRGLKVIYTRDFSFGGQQLTEEIMRTYGLSMEEAGRAKKEGGLPGNFQAEVLDPFIDDMTQQVSRSLQFYLASGSGREQPEKILICGGCANIPGVADVIEPRRHRGGAGRPARPDEAVVARQGAGRQSRCDGPAHRLRAGTPELRRLTCHASTYFRGVTRSARNASWRSWSRWAPRPSPRWSRPSA
jgi:type IV pilus assembly protein PilM